MRESIHSVLVCINSVKCIYIYIYIISLPSEKEMYGRRRKYDDSDSSDSDDDLTEAQKQQIQDELIVRKAEAKARDRGEYEKLNNIYKNVPSVLENINVKDSLHDKGKVDFEAPSSHVPVKFISKEERMRRESEKLREDEGKSMNTKNPDEDISSNGYQIKESQEDYSNNNSQERDRRDRQNGNREKEIFREKGGEFSSKGDNKRKVNHRREKDQDENNELETDYPQETNTLISKRRRINERKKQMHSRGKDAMDLLEKIIDEEAELETENDPFYTSFSSSGSRRKLTKKENGQKLEWHHWRSKDLHEMTKEDWRIVREDFTIFTKGADIPFPLRNWEEAHLPQLLYKAIQSLGFKEPTPIQRQAIPIGLQCRDILGISETGSGKTMAFVIPMLNYILNLPERLREQTESQGPLALVMAPSKELSEQIYKVVKDLGDYCGVQAVNITRGKDITEHTCLDGKHDVIIGTPGKLKDWLEQRYIVLNQCSYIVLDEVDKMLDQRMKEDVVDIMDNMGGIFKSQDKQESFLQQTRMKDGDDSNGLYLTTSMFSATLNPDIERIVKKYLRHPAEVKIGKRNFSVNTRIRQDIIFLKDPARKFKKLVYLLNDCLDMENEKIIIFVATQNDTLELQKKLTHALDGSRCNIGYIHGGMKVDYREEMYDKFKNDNFNIIVATDVLGRGIDIPDVTHVVNYDMPQSFETYPHRIGRTGRAGRDGASTSLITEKDSRIFFELKNYLVETKAVIPELLSKHSNAQNPLPGYREGNN